MTTCTICHADPCRGTQAMAIMDSLDPQTRRLFERRQAGGHLPQLWPFGARRPALLPM